MERRLACEAVRSETAEGSRFGLRMVTPASLFLSFV
jgi:hypothetical protein